LLPVATSRIALILALGLVMGLARVPTTVAAFAGLTSSPANRFAFLEVQPASQNGPSASGGTVQLSWGASPTAATEAVTYAVLRSPSGAGAFAQVGSTSGLAITDTPPDGTYDYRIRTVVSSFSRDSGTRTVLSDATAPIAATGLSATTGASNGSIDLAWTAGTDATSGVSGYTIRHVAANKCPSASPTAYPNTRSAGAVTSATVSGLAKGRHCFYLVTIDGVGNQSGPSNVVDATAK
jgi:hypothetical protein